MDANEREYLYELCQKAIGAAYEVANVLGSGFLEKVYERALVRELTLRGLSAEPQAQVIVSYKGETIGEYYPDILVDGKLIIELKCVERLSNEHLAQCINYLKATGHSMALLVNFQHAKIEWRCVVNHL